jgi:hypothetical protein
MSNLLKDQIKTDLDKAKEEGTLRAERIRDIVQVAVSQAVSEIKAGSSEIRSVAKDAISAVIEASQEKGEKIKEEVSASIEGAIAAISSVKRQTIAESQSEVKQLQAKIDAEEEELQAEIDGMLSDIEETGKDKSAETKAAIESAIYTIKDSDEVALMQRRYAQLKAQLAIVQANLAERYGERYENVKPYLDDAQAWYERAKKDPEMFTDKVDQKRTEFEQKLGEAGSSLAKKERQGKQLLRELWKSITELFKDK